ncbi:MAG: acyltransferase [Beijerinckiaceae bacterium]|nr:acyltransferase [Beijerinckiaceae bacterium]
MSAPDHFIPAGLAELKTPEGTFLIQERRSRPRDPSAPKPETSPTPEKETHAFSPAMSALAGVIILGVLVGSYTVKYDLAIGHAQGAPAIPAVGFIALQLFLACSSYRLFHAVRQYRDVWSYVGHRLLRYLPATIPAVLLGFVVAQFSGIPALQTKISSLPANLMMMADMVGVSDIDSAHWRLKIELIMSISAGVTWFTPLRRFLPAILLACLAVNIAYLNGEPARQNILTLHGVLTADGYLPFLAFGVALHHLVLNRSSAGWQIVAAASVVLVFFSNTPVHGLWTVASLGVLTAIAAGRLQFLGKLTWLVRLGNLAFPIYVVHFVTGFALIRGMEMVGIPPAVAMLAAAGAAILLGQLFHVVFERPAATHAPVLIAALAVKMPLLRRLRSSVAQTALASATS